MKILEEQNFIKVDITKIYLNLWLSNFAFEVMITDNKALYDICFRILKLNHNIQRLELSCFNLYLRSNVIHIMCWIKLQILSILISLWSQNTGQEPRSSQRKIQLSKKADRNWSNCQLRETSLRWWLRNWSKRVPFSGS